MDLILNKLLYLDQSDRVPGVGGRVIEAGLKSPCLDNRRRAVQVLADWGQAHWSSRIAAQLQRLRKQEPNERLRRCINNVVVGRPIEEGLEEAN